MEKIEREEGYIDSLNLDFIYETDFENLLVEYEKGKLTRREYMVLNMMAHSATRSDGFSSGYEAREKRNQRLIDESEQLKKENEELKQELAKKDLDINDCRILGL